MKASSVLHSKGQFLINKKTCLYFLDGISLAAPRHVNLSRLQCVQGECRLFVYYILYSKSLYSPWTHYRLFIIQELTDIRKN